MTDNDVLALRVTHLENGHSKIIEKMDANTAAVNALATQVAVLAERVPEKKTAEALGIGGLGAAVMVGLIEIVKKLLPNGG
jgi:hypothetical protein